MIVSEGHQKLAEEACRLFERLGVPTDPVAVPLDQTYLSLVPALHAIVDRLEKLERDAVIEKLERVRFTEADVAELKRLIARDREG